MTLKRASIIAAFMLSLLARDATSAHESYEFDLPEQSLAESLRQIGQRTTINILFDAASVENKSAPAVKGIMSAERVLEKVLAGTDLVVEEVNWNSVLVASQERTAYRGRRAWLRRGRGGKRRTRARNSGG